ncbi:branched-chain amino acid ABC transporter permease [Propylenella binzhouense]|uniref:Branched-chain amino acid ABC transporter permease n=1 Tax=Propylenella binzhouense TaxID=2555902 RepID=A0A964T3F7_9HYPH|nr:branched-chain amino acid ABC transporter permease [Propylenella binzhouense]MYZ47786.1 branched-chain amino acid ABC transporter permease [Propylenella binzhouense]
MAFADLIMTALLSGGLYALVSVGLNLQYGVARILDLAYGELMMLAAFGTFWAFTLAGLSPLLTLVLGAPVAFAFNLLLFRLVFRPLVRRSRDRASLEVNAILSTFGLVFLLQGAALALWGGSDRAYSYLAEPVTVLGSVTAANRLLALAGALVTAAAAYLVLRFTRTGRALRAIASNAASAPLVGIDVERLSGWAFAAGGLLAGVAGVLVSSFININPAIGTEYTMKALIVVTMGGIGNVLGGLLAGLALGFAETMGAAFIDPGLVTAIAFALFILVLVLRPEGLLGRRRR